MRQRGILMTEPAGPLGRYAPVDPPSQRPAEPKVAVHLLGLPLPLLAASREHHDELMREFRLMALANAVPSNAAPRRLLELVQVLGVQYAGQVQRPNEEIEAALTRGDSSIDVTYEVTANVADAARMLEALMQEADEYCAAEQLLTLARTPSMVEFARWYLRNFIDQIDGAAPQRWNGPTSP